MSFLSAVGRHWFVAGLLLALSVAFTQTESLAGLTRYPLLGQVVIALTLFAMAWPVPFAEIRNSLARPWPAVWAIVLSVGLFPLVAWGFSFGFHQEFAAGVIVVGAIPTTLASAAVWTRRAGGNDVVCLIATMVTNGLCFLITPLWVFLLLGSAVAPGELKATIVLLLWAVVAPIALAQLVRGLPGAAAWPTRHKTLLGAVAQCGILWIVLLGSIQAAQRMQADSASLGWMEVLGLGAGLVALHLVMWWVAFASSQWLGFSRGDQIAIGFSASQKTLMVGLAVALQLDLSVLPLVIYHLLQLLIDTVIVGGLRSRRR